MAGKRTIEQADFVTPRAEYRSNLTAVDTVATALEDPTVPTLDTSKSSSAPIMGNTGDVGMYGRNAQQNWALIVEGFSSVTVELWLKATIDARYAHSGASPSSSSGAGDTEPNTKDWVLAATTTITKSTLWVVKDIPPGKYKLVFKTAVSTGHLTMREQHAA